jgi:DNA processing protein
LDAAWTHHPDKIPPREQWARLKLIRTETIGPITFFQLIHRFGSGEQALDALPELARKGGRKAPLMLPKDQDLEVEWRALEKFGGRFVFFGDPDYPILLSYIPDPPPLISCKGRLDLLKTQSLSMVGARNASLNGRHFAKRLAHELGQEGYSLVSGLARGIDKSAHEGSLGTGTVAVLAGGLNIIYPTENTDLYEKIAQEGVLVAESPFGFTPQASSFPRRNRLISGLSRGVVVIEAALKSGSLITATYGLEQGRDIFAVPGSPLDPRCQGTNHLIQNGAYLIQNTEDILTQLSPLETLHPSEAVHLEEGEVDGFETAHDPQLRQKILELLSFTPLHLDELMRECQIYPTKVHMLLLEMEVAGLICRHPGHRVSLRTDLTGET